LFELLMTTVLAWQPATISGAGTTSKGRLKTSRARWARCDIFTGRLYEKARNSVGAALHRGKPAPKLLTCSND
jgi:hypothetical protein